MKIEIKKTNLILAVFITFFFVGFASATPNPGHNATEVGPGTFSSGDYKFPGNLDIMNSLFMPTDAKGIFWTTSSQDVSKPHIDYSSTTGLWISTGTTGTNVYIEGGNLTVNEGITLGGITRYSWPELSQVPAGFCIFSDTETSCPSGWTRRTDFDGRTIRASSVPGGKGGYNQHSHSFVLPKNIKIDGSHKRGAWGGTVYNTHEASSWPPFINVIICCKTSEVAVQTPPEMPAAQLMASECPAGEYMAGINPDGTLICKELKITHTLRWQAGGTDCNAKKGTGLIGDPGTGTWTLITNDCQSSDGSGCIQSLCLWGDG